MRRYIYDQAFFWWSVTFLGFFFWIHLRDFCLPSGQIDCYCLRSMWLSVVGALLTPCWSLDRPLAMEYSCFLSFDFILVRAVIFMCYYDVMLLATRYALGHHIIIHEVSDFSLSSAQTFSDTMREKANSRNTASLHVAQSRKQIWYSRKEFAIPH